MAVGLLGQKCGMTRVFTEAGESVPVTVIKIDPNFVSQVKTLENDGYCALQITTDLKKQSKVSKPLAGHFAKANVGAGRFTKEFRLDSSLQEFPFAIGEEVPLTVFKEGQNVDVTSVSKGKGFQGGVKRHNFAMQDATHGNSLSHRAIGSTGQNQSPGKVFKGKKMPGQMGNKQCTVLSQRLFKIDQERNCLYIEGGVPGAPGSYVVINTAVKRPNLEESK